MRRRSANGHALPGPEHSLVCVRLEPGDSAGGLEALVAEKVLDFGERDTLWTSHEAHV